MKKIAVNSIPLLSPLSGVGRYTYEICKRLDRESLGADITFFYGYKSGRVLSPGDNAFGKNSNSFFTRLLRKSLKKVLTAVSAFSPDRYDLYWEPNNILENYFKSKSVLFTLHDISVIRHPQWHPAQRVELFKKRLMNSVKRADMIITDSMFSKNEILDYFNLPECAVKAIHLGYDTMLFHNIKNSAAAENLKIKYTGGRDFILFSGSLEPRKNLSGLIKAYLSLPNSIKNNYKLLLVGGDGWNNNEIHELIDVNKDNVLRAGYINYDELANLYRAASVFAFPSHYEGFGLPPLEAMACGCPVLVSSNSSLPEVCGDAAHYVHAESIESIREGLVKVLTDSTYAAALSRAGLEQCKKFSWDTTAEEHMICMKELM
ncbi:glycosyltransferase family 1 protein [Seleniivibrio woodruffii]|uniref:glycosyltransferase family 4 protein n=1 Tax=Seleniivibrio woodruffii TaxID=1078050 RepID=UPI0026EC119E|nr:glycosyltransferase family 1 protein [Seleniivibrio woodruffii]